MSFTPAFASKPRLFILAGVPGCGKSTWAHRFFRAQSIVSTDVIREQKWPGEPYNHERNEAVFDEFHYRLGSLLHDGQDAVADATSLTDEARWKLQTVAGYHDVECHLVFFDNPYAAGERNGRRTGGAKVPPHAMDLMYEKFFKSRPAILGEKYTSITIIKETI